MRRAPTTRAKQSRERTRGLNPEGAQKYRDWQKIENAVLLNNLKRMCRQDIGLIMTPEAGVQFVAEFAELADAARGRNVVDLEKFGELVRRSDIPYGELSMLQHMLMHYDGFAGKKLMFTMSADGDEESTIRICNHALLNSKTRPRILRSAEINFERGRLREIAGKGESSRAMVLEGKIARVLGQEDYAIQLWEQAMSAVVAQSEAEAAASKPLGSESLAALMGSRERDAVELSSPWVDLTLVRYDRYVRFHERRQFGLALAEHEGATQAMQVGCSLDDPESHYHAAHLFKSMNDDGSTMYTSSWLYHMTKAAASGLPIAAHQLTIFYAESGWKYIEDEPPAHVRPTPFDSYPAAEETHGSDSGFLPTLRRLLGYDDSEHSTSSSSSSSPPAVRESDAMFHTAIFTQDPATRWALALSWANVATARRYAPAFLYRAKMLLQETLWAEAKAPLAALNMTEQRYSYASKADYEAGIRKPDAKPTPDSTASSSSSSTATATSSTATPAAQDPPNPYYNPPEARIWLTQVFYATLAHDLRRRLIADATRPPSSGTRRSDISALADVADVGSVDDFRRDKYPPGTPEYITCWLYDTDVREMWEHEVEGMTAEIRRICDERGWDLVDEEGDGGLMYRARGRGATGEAAREAAREAAGDGAVEAQGR
ncbi:hypothetical protein LTR91_007738 [Friedmanniomyces endolithicus]|uniref:Uncharacterized protein n=1 Tax=Friedmanniomyces endolithicus TaxID=329885 RepID=A0AAN6KPF6_9PEZI|nr:hypothetical protein LTR91_007738 [Friedmanniomyces endolithicus]